MQGSNKIYIKGMVCDRCISTIKHELSQLHVPVTEVQLGELTSLSTLSVEDIGAIREVLLPLGFTLLEDKRIKMVREVRALVELVYSGNWDFETGFTFSALVRERINRDYEWVSTVFAALEGSTLERYIINYRIEKVKELLVYSPQTLTDIAFCLGFSSVSHLSAQFRNETGLTPSHFKKIRQEKSSISKISG
ncbi:MAG: helix-turn-helix transcriptional regulator [Chitinophagaceae bacterium]|nr:helix-turn-helix transcriptional regulator [Chitinophagaceae bacterium]